MSEIKPPKLSVLFFENPSHVASKILEQHRLKTLRKLERIGVKINGTYFVNSQSNTDEVALALRKADPDLVLCCFTSWVEEYLSLRVLNSLDIPIFLWSIPKDTAHSLLSGITAAASNFQQIGRTYFHGVGTEESHEIFREIQDWALAASLKRRSRGIRIGLFGQNCPGMMDVGGDDRVLASLGPEVIRYELSDLVERYTQVPEDSAKRAVEEWTNVAGGGIEPGSEELLRSARLYLALKEKIETEGLEMIGVRCWPELRSQFKVSPCLAFSSLMDQGIMGICENDPTAGLTMWLLHGLSGEAVFLGDTGRIDLPKGTISFCHCGLASSTLAEDRREVFIRRYALEPEGGQCIEFRLKRGPVTLAKLMRPRGGTFSMFIARGESVEGPEHRGSVIYVKPDGGVDRFISKMLEDGVEHHIVIGYGDLVASLLRWCHLTRVRVVSP